MANSIFYQLSCPSKTFLLGEYAVLKNGPALLINTEPRFTLEITSDEAPAKYRGLILAGPIAELFKRHPHYQNHRFEFYDPHLGSGGLGASSAQYLLLNKFFNHQNQSCDELLQQYKEDCARASCAPGSGADLISQQLGNITLFNPSQQQFESYSWPFTDITALLIKTGNKVTTHQHLQELTSFDEKPLIQIANQAIDAFLLTDSKSFIDSINRYAQQLLISNLVTEQTQDIIRKFLTLKNLKAIKGCGALGADVILVISHNKHVAEISDFCQGRFNIIASSKQISSGLCYQENVLGDL